MEVCSHAGYSTFQKFNINYEISVSSFKKSLFYRTQKEWAGIPQIWNPNQRQAVGLHQKIWSLTDFSYDHQTCKEKAKVAPFVMRHRWKRKLGSNSKSFWENHCTTIDNYITKLGLSIAASADKVLKIPMEFNRSIWFIIKYFKHISRLHTKWWPKWIRNKVISWIPKVNIYLNKCLEKQNNYSFKNHKTHWIHPHN